MERAASSGRLYTTSIHTQSVGSESDENSLNKRRKTQRAERVVARATGAVIKCARFLLAIAQVQGSSTKPRSANWSRDAAKMDKHKHGMARNEAAKTKTRFSEREHRSVAKLEWHRPLLIELTGVAIVVLSMFPSMARVPGHVARGADEPAPELHDPAPGRHVAQTSDDPAPGRRGTHHEHVPVPGRTHLSLLMIDDEDVEHPWANTASTSQNHTGQTTWDECWRIVRQVRVLDVHEGVDQQFYHAGCMAPGSDFMSVVGNT